MKDGIWRVTHTVPKQLATLNPLSASATSPGRIICRNELFSVICLSDTQPPHPIDTKLIASCGEILIRYLAVL